MSVISTLSDDDVAVLLLANENRKFANVIDDRVQDSGDPRPDDLVRRGYLVCIDRAVRLDHLGVRKPDGDLVTNILVDVYLLTDKALLELAERQASP